ncbi:hypothetical protein ABEB36_003139 [Hypothenemus hampei]|uniref:Fibronectin type-III domain-containing protein n=1 Tax=Hypothenemus hampei TaxID=57062 RepID=A0ABD1F851_HYPHA
MGNRCRKIKNNMVFVRLFVFSQLFWFVQSISLTYILKRQKTSVQPTCLAEGLERYSAVGWIYPIPDDNEILPKSVSRYIPTIHNDYNCKFSKNEKCNVKWAVKDWKIDETSSRTREFIDDNRWEDIPVVLITNRSNEFQNRFHLENAERIGFSVRASGSVEVFLCTGWNPQNYPCYYFSIDIREIQFSKLTALTDLQNKNVPLEYAQVASNVISDVEWRSFEIRVEEGNVTLIDKNNMDRVLINHVDSDPMKPLYFLMRSSERSLWKVIENHFMYTETSQISRLGPKMQSNFKDFCLSMLVSTCSYCRMTFFYMNGTIRHELNSISPTNKTWTEIKLKQENIQLKRFNLFVQTEFVNEPNGESKGWWAYDDVRICNENEVKGTYLKLNQSFAPDDTSVADIFCQLVKKPNFRPDSLEYDEIQDNLFTDFPPVDVSSNDTSITLKWIEEDPDHYLTYFIHYQGNDFCSAENEYSLRLASGGFLTTKHNEVTISRLVPFTTYNITLSSVLHEKDLFLNVQTLESDEVHIEELPIKIHIRPLESAVNVSWDKPNCNSRYGRLIYNVTISNEKLNLKKVVELQTNNSYFINELASFTTYDLIVSTARNPRYLLKGIKTQNMTYHFTTLPGVATSVRNLELYAIGPNKASFRYDLPDNPHGIPSHVEVIKCNVLSRAKCRSLESRISRCVLWPEKMCVDADYLMPNQNYTFKVSIKNENTNTYGTYVEIAAESVERVPAKPENVTYQVVNCEENTDYCHVNISWLHPYEPNGTISAFNIILNSTYYNSSYSEEDQSIHEVYKIINDTYLPSYTYQVKYVPYSSEYDMYVQSINSKYKSDFTVVKVNTEDLGNHIDQSPKLLGKGDKAVVFKLPHVDRRLESYSVTIAVQDFNQSIPLGHIKNKKLSDNVCHPYGLTWISQTLEVKQNETKIVTIKGLDEKRTIKPNTKYCFIFVITNKYRGEEHDVVYYERLITPNSMEPSSENDTPQSSSFNHLYILIVVVALVILSFLLFWYVRRRNARKPKQTINENVYESLPFEEHEKNFVNNQTYDHLIHK